MNPNAMERRPGLPDEFAAEHASVPAYSSGRTCSIGSAKSCRGDGRPWSESTTTSGEVRSVVG